MPLGLLEFLATVGLLRVLLLLGMVVAAWRAVYLHLQNDHRSPMPWAFLIVTLVTTLAMASLST